jgi:hypothetical protein
MAEAGFDALLVELRSVAERADPAPDSVLAAAKEAFVWRTVDAELAELVADSTLLTGRVRAADAPRLLTFRAGELDVEVEVAEVGHRRHLTGQLVPTSSGSVTVRWRGGSLDVPADEMGRFAAEGVPAGSISLVIRRAGVARATVTTWMSV